MDTFVAVDLVDLDAMERRVVEAVAAVRIDGVPLLNEGTLLSCVRIARRLGLPTLNPATAAASRNKYVSYLLWAAAGVPTPVTVPLHDDKESLDLVARCVGFPAVIKFADAMNSQGVVKVAGPAAFLEARRSLLKLYRAPQSQAPDRNRFAYGRSAVPLIAQSFCDGPEVAVELFVRNGRPEVVGMFEKAASSGPYFPESMSVFPSSLSRTEETAATEVACSALQALGADRGAAHVEVRFHQGEPRVLEAGLRPGGAYTAQAVELLSGFNMIGAVVLDACDLEAPAAAATEGAALYGGVLFPASGTLSAVEGDGVFDEIDGLIDVQVLARVGDRISGGGAEAAQPHYCYYLISGQDREAVLARHRRIQSSLRLSITTNSQSHGECHVAL